MAGEALSGAGTGASIGTLIAPGIGTAVRRLSGGNVQKILVGREIADFRVRAGNGKYVVEDEFGEIRIVPQSNVASVEPAPDVTVEELFDRYEAELLED